ncbi:hypothetical protein HDU85_003776 [Gaertneriomyces sp. JEL0708]|nr:hypothetical protein HDU85_003776 [Gaertneriomyces sp. JEL0708]
MLKFPVLLNITAFLRNDPDAEWRDYVAHADAVLASLREMLKDHPELASTPCYKEKWQKAERAKTLMDQFESEREQMVCEQRMTLGLLQGEQRVAVNLISAHCTRNDTVCDLVRTPPSKKRRAASTPTIPTRSPVFSGPSSPDDLCEWRQRVCESVTALKGHEVLLNGVNAAKILKRFQKVLLASHSEKASIDLKETEVALAAHGCLLLTDRKPPAYHACVTDEEYRQLVDHFDERSLPVLDTDWDTFAEVVSVLYSLTAAVKDGRQTRWIPPPLDPETCSETEVARHRCYNSLASLLSPTENMQCLESTWISRHVLPLLSLLRSEDIDFEIDSTTEYNNKRPDMFFKIGSHCRGAGRAICSWELKAPAKGPVIIACIQYLKAEHSRYVGEVTAQFKLAVHLPGWQGTVYEVFLLPKMFIAVEVGKLTLPRSLASGQEIPIATAIRQWEILFHRVRRVKDAMVHDTERARGESGSLLPPTPSKKAKRKPRAAVTV